MKNARGHSQPRNSVGDVERTVLIFWVFFFGFWTGSFEVNLLSAGKGVYIKL